VSPPQKTWLPQPWLDDALEQLDLRRDDRCLVLTCPTPAHVAAVSRVVGKTARIVVVEPDQELAEFAARGKHENLEVLAYEPEGHERFGTFDALLACPLTTIGWSIEVWTELIVANLRPGGRFVLDLPAETLCDPLIRAWSQVEGEPRALEQITGPSESELAETLRRRGLRGVEASMGTHLAHLESPYVLAEFVGSLIEDPEMQANLARTLVEQMQTTDGVDVVFHRTRVHGLR
jgi:hypothetical protein